MPQPENFKHDRRGMGARRNAPLKRRPSLGEHATLARKASENRRSITVISVIFAIMAFVFVAYQSDTPFYSAYLNSPPKSTSQTDEGLGAAKTKKQASATKPSSDSEFYKKVTTKNETGLEHWSHIAREALNYYQLDESWYYLILAMIKVESNGNVGIDIREDIMQAWEGDGKSIVVGGVPQKGIEGGTPESSIYAGAFELSECAKDFTEAFGRPPRPDDRDDVGLLAQGYNYGHRGWFKYCAKRGIDTWSLDASSSYQSSIGGVGTAGHGGKVQAAWDQFRETA